MTKDNKELPAPPPRRGDTTTLINKSEKGILCPKCQHLNRPGSTKCSVCESHLHIKCNDCGARNERVSSRCHECGRRLHKSVFEKMQRSVFNHGSKITVWQAALLVLAVVAIFLLILAVNKFRIPIPQ